MEHPSYNPAVASAVAVASVAAAAVHLGAVHEHLEEYLPAAIFMLVLGIAQAVWMFVFRARPSQRLLIAGATGNACVVLLWLVSRTAGLPFAAERWTPEAIHATDAFATALEVAIVLGCVALAKPGSLALGRRFVVAVFAASAIAPLVAGEDPAPERAGAIACVVLIAEISALRFVASGASVWRGKQDEEQEDRLGSRLRGLVAGAARGASIDAPAARGHLDLVGR